MSPALHKSIERISVGPFYVAGTNSYANFELSIKTS